MSTRNPGLMFFVYRALIAPIAVALLPLAALFNSKLREGLRLRRLPVEPPASPAPPLWIHASSGEFEYAKPVIRRLKERHPALPIVVTYFSPTYAKSVSSFPGVTRSLPLPLDLPGPCRSFLRRFKPRALLISRTDLWPEMLQQSRRAGLPRVIFSYTQKSFRSPMKKNFTRWMLQWIDRIYCVSPADREQLSTVDLNAPIAVMGDTRYDQVAYRLNHPKALPDTLRPGGVCLVAGSTWPEDETVLLPALAPLLRERRLKLILVPHEPTDSHIAALRTQLRELDLRHSLFSTNANWADAHILIVDQVGVLAELYAWGQLAFIGGSFRKSVHSVMEALGAGLMTFVGPYYDNNREAVEFRDFRIGSFMGVNVVQTVEEFENAVRQAVANLDELGGFQSSLKAEFNRRLGATDRLIESLEQFIDLN